MNSPKICNVTDGSVCVKKATSWKGLQKHCLYNCLGNSQKRPEINVNIGNGALHRPVGVNFKEWWCLHPCCWSAHTMSTVSSVHGAPVFIDHIQQLLPYCRYSLISRSRVGLHLWTSTELHQSIFTHQRNMIHVEGRRNKLICSVKSTSNNTAANLWSIFKLTTCCNEGLEKRH